MTDEPINQFKEAEKIELVSEAEGGSPSLVDALTVPAAAPIAVTPVDGETTGVRPDQGNLTPWKRQLNPRNPPAAAAHAAKNWKMLILLVVVCLLVSPIIAVASAISCVPHGAAIVEMRIGQALGNRAIILDGFKRGWDNKPEQVGIMIQMANERSRIDKTAAIDLYNDCVRINPNVANCYMNRGLNYECLHRYDLALADFNKAIQLNPRYPLGFNNRGYLNRELQNYDRAMSDHNKAVELEPDQAIFYFNRALTCGLLGNHALELSDLLKCKELGFRDPTLQKRINAARSQLYLDNSDDR